jgi:hypothetical protein
MVAIWALALATPIATLIKDLMIAYTLILYTYWMIYIGTILYVCIQTLEV